MQIAVIPQLIIIELILSYHFLAETSIAVTYYDTLVKIMEIVFFLFIYLE